VTGKEAIVMIRYILSVHKFGKLLGKNGRKAVGKTEQANPSDGTGKKERGK